MHDSIRRSAVSHRGLLGAFVFVAAFTAPARDLPGDRFPGAKPCVIESLERPTILLTREQLTALRHDVRPGGSRHDLYNATVRRNADRWLNRPVTIPQRAGHYHHFTCSDGARLAVPANQEFTTTGTYQCTACGKEWSGEKFDGGRRNYEHMWLKGAALDLALAGALEQNSAYTRKAAEILRKYADAYPGRHTKPTEGGIFYQSLDESMFMIPLAQTYDLLYDSGVLSPGDKAHIEKDLFWESAAGLVACGSKTNWGSWHLSAVGVIGLATRHQGYIDHGVREFQRQMREELGDDGLWPESVHTYHFFPLQAFVAFAEAATNSGTDLWTWEARPGKGLRAMFTAPLNYMYPDMRLPAINDGWFNSWLPLDIYEAAASRLGDPEIVWAARKRRNGSGSSAGTAIENLIWSLVARRNGEREVTTPSLAPTNFPVLGICTLRSGNGSGTDTMMTLDYGRHLGHGQADQMGITLHSGGRLLAADYGTPSYGSPILPFYKGTSSHNTVMVDGADQRPARHHELLAFEDGAQVDFASARTREAYPGVDWRRTVLLTRDYALVLDDLTSSESHRYDFLFHCEGTDLSFTGVNDSSTSAVVTDRFFQQARTYRADKGEYEALWSEKGKPLLTLVSACEPGTELVAARCPAETGLRTVPVLTQRQEGKNAHFAMLLVPAGEMAPHLSLVRESPETLLVKGAGVLDRVKVTSHELHVVRVQDGKEEPLCRATLGATPGGR